jgi:hypothetical protein
MEGENASAESAIHFPHASMDNCGANRCIESRYQRLLTV